MVPTHARKCQRGGVWLVLLQSAVAIPPHMGTNGPLPK